jgi:hypothetical protein
MANPLFTQFGQAMPNGMEQIVQQVRSFKEQFKGDPREEVQRLLNSGQMSQQQFNELSQQAQQILRFMGGR